MEAGLAEAAGFLVEAAAGGDIGLHAEDGVDAQLPGLLIELQRAVQVAVVGQSQGVHLQGLGAVQQRLDGAGPVQETVVAVAMEMGERVAAQGNSFYSRGSPTARR